MPITKRNKLLSFERFTEEDDTSKDRMDWSSMSVKLRAEKSRTAAKKRRDLECKELDRLSQLLPFPEDITSKLDKGTVLRLTISYLRMKQYAQKDGRALLDELKLSTQSTDEKLNNGLQVKDGQMMLDVLTGFLIFVTKKGLIYYVSEELSHHLGLKQEELIGRNILEYVHPDDKGEFAKQFHEKPPGRSCSFHALPPSERTQHEEEECDGVHKLDSFVEERLFYMRMKCHITKKGTKTRQNGFLLMQWSGRVKLGQSRTKPDSYNIIGLIAICRPMQSSPMLEIKLDGNMFMSRHDLAMTFTFCDPRILALVGYEPSELIGKTVYQFHNPLDAQKIHTCYSTLIHKGTSVSKYYRFLGKNGDWIWMQTRATVIYNTKNEPQYVVCMNYVISQEEGRRFLMMEQETKGIRHTDARGVIDVTNCSTSAAAGLHTANSSGYSSCDDEYAYHVAPSAVHMMPSLDFDMTMTAVNQPVVINVADVKGDAAAAAAVGGAGGGASDGGGNDLPIVNADDLNWEELLASHDWMSSMCTGSGAGGGGGGGGAKPVEIAEASTSASHHQHQQLQQQQVDGGFVSGGNRGSVQTDVAMEVDSINTQTILESLLKDLRAQEGSSVGLVGGGELVTTPACSVACSVSAGNVDGLGPMHIDSWPMDMPPGMHYSQSTPLLQASTEQMTLEVPPLPGRVISAPRLQTLAVGSEGMADMQQAMLPDQLQQLSMPQFSLQQMSPLRHTLLSPASSMASRTAQVGSQLVEQMAGLGQPLNSPNVLNSPNQLNSPNALNSPNQLNSPNALNSPNQLNSPIQLNSPSSVNSQIQLNGAVQMNSSVGLNSASSASRLCSSNQLNSPSQMSSSTQMLASDTVGSPVTFSLDYGFIDNMVTSQDNSYIPSSGTTTAKSRATTLSSSSSSSSAPQMLSSLKELEQLKVITQKSFDSFPSPLPSPTVKSAEPPAREHATETNKCSRSHSTVVDQKQILTSILDDHRYTTHTPPERRSPTRHHKSRRSSNSQQSAQQGSATTSHHSQSTKTTSSSSQPASLLEQMLLCKQPLRPNQGSDSPLTNEISQLNIQDSRDSTLKRLLKGTMDTKEIEAAQEQIITCRRQPGDPPGLQHLLEYGTPRVARETPRETQRSQHDMMLKTSPASPQYTFLNLDNGMNVLTSLSEPDFLDSMSTMDTLWKPTTPEEEELLISTEIDEILREQMRQDKLWLQHYLL